MFLCLKHFIFINIRYFHLVQINPKNVNEIEKQKQQFILNKEPH